MQQQIIKTQIELPKQVDKMLKMIKVEFDLENKSEAVEFVIESFKGEFTPDIEQKFAEALAAGHAKVSARRAKTVKDMNKEMERW